VAASTGIITTVAGNGDGGYSGDGGLATAAEINPTGIAFDTSNNLYFSSLRVVRKIDAGTGIISTVVGNGYYGFRGDGGSPTIAELSGTAGIGFDSSGNLYIADGGNYRIREVSVPGQAATPVFSLAAGAYVGPRQVSITDSVQGATIYYTTDGTTPTTGSTVYSGAITVSATETLQAIAAATGYTQSAVATAAYTINLPATPSITWAAPAVITYGTALSSVQLNATSSVPGTFVYSPASGTVLGAGQQTLTVTFTPTDSTDYATATATVTLTVNKATPSITWAAPAAIPYGTALSATQLDATASVAGTFVYNPAAGAIEPVGSDTLSVNFTPTDSTDYLPATATVTLAVTNPVPVMGSLAPALTSAGGAAFTLTVTGSGFAPTSTVFWGTTALATQYGSATQLTAQVTAAEIASSGVTVITVQTPAPGGGTSNPLQFEVDSSGSGSTAPFFTTLTATVAPGSTASYPATLPSSVTSATVTCLNLPAGATCSYSPTTNTLTIATSTTTPAGTYPITVVFTETVTGAATAGILLPFLLLPLVFLRKKLAVRGIWIAAVVVVLTIAVSVSIGCGGGGGGSSSTQTQTHQAISSGSVTITIQ